MVLSVYMAFYYCCYNLPCLIYMANVQSRCPYFLFTIMKLKFKTDKKLFYDQRVKTDRKYPHLNCKLCTHVLSNKSDFYQNFALQPTTKMFSKYSFQRSLPDSESVGSGLRCNTLKILPKEYLCED